MNTHQLLQRWEYPANPDEVVIVTDLKLSIAKRINNYREFAEYKPFTIKSEYFISNDSELIERHIVPITDIYRKGNERIAICLSPEVEHLLQLPMSVLTSANEILSKTCNRLHVEINDIRNMTFWQRLKFLFTGKPE